MLHQLLKGKNQDGFPIKNVGNDGRGKRVDPEFGK
jgi:hypothetical protein